ncbi:Y-family DNA polymerase [Aquimonas sp.]|jgi:protein ImuB|uniref:Y-family DNA polymerase n=1 Tax=Aquimonas sp. TaxID=1872588 RepID=UPI0037C07141
MSATPPPSALWAAVHLPQLALDAVLRQHPEPEAPLALLTGPAQRRVLLDANPAARRLGLQRGQSLAAAQALCADLRTHEHRPVDSERLRELLAAWAYRYSSMVCLPQTDSIVLEIGRSFGLFGQWPAFERRLRADLGALGVSHRIAAAPTVAGACVLATHRDGLAVDRLDPLRHALDPLPVDALALSPRAADSLHGMGLRSLRQLFALPRAGLARRFGPELLDQLDRLLGHSADPQDLYRPPERFEARVEFSYEVEHIAPLLFPLRRLCSDLAEFLTARDGGVQRFELALEHEGQAASSVEVGLLAPEREAQRLFELARGRLERLPLPKAAIALHLLATELPPFVPARSDLFETGPGQTEPWNGLRERLRARLGEDALSQLVLTGDPRPERAQQNVSERRSRDPAQRPLPRPTWLLPEPRALREAVAMVIAGPERIEAGWWDDADQRRDYYLIETTSGQRAWAFRPAGDPASVQGWMLQGWFA